MANKTEKETDTKLAEAVKDLEHALSFIKKPDSDKVYFAAVSKNFETCFEYAWKHLKRKVTAEGVDAYSPKEVIKQAGRLGFIDEVEAWLKFLEDRNLAVHDYLGVKDEDYLKTIRAFLPEARKLTR